MATRKTIEMTYEELERDELSPEETQDLLTATQARHEANAYYSNFKFGAAIRTHDDKVVRGWNVENLVYDVLHAEENALGRIEEKSRQTGMKRITIVGAPDGVESEDPVTPCRLCRQKLLEFFRRGDQTVVIAAGVRGKVQKMQLEDLLPNAFFPACLQDEPKK